MFGKVKNARARASAHAASAIASAGHTLALEPERAHANDEQFTSESVVKGQRCSQLVA